MQKVITVTIDNSNLRSVSFVETEYPIINGYLEQGYKVVQIVPLSLGEHDNQYTFVLEKFIP